jgi:hypothetical protein
VIRIEAEAGTVSNSRKATKAASNIFIISSMSERPPLRWTYCVTLAQAVLIRDIVRGNDLTGSAVGGTASGESHYLVVNYAKVDQHG